MRTRDARKITWSGEWLDGRFSITGTVEVGGYEYRRRTCVAGLSGPYRRDPAFLWETLALIQRLLHLDMTRPEAA
jgi:hypothetical protein